MSGTLSFLLIGSIQCGGFSAIEAEACAAEFGGEFGHLSAHSLVDDASVDLGGGELGNLYPS